MKTYTGDRTIDGIKVTVDGNPLNERCDIEQFTDLGFEWTYDGASPRQLALAILVDHLGDAQEARALTNRFSAEIIAELDNTWKLTSTDIDAIIAKWRAE